MNESIRDFRVGFAKGGGKAKGGGVVGAVLDAVSGTSGGCGTGTVSGKKGFQKGNKCAGKGGTGSPAVKAAGAHRSARVVVNRHIKAGTLNTKAGRAAVKSAAHHARIVRDAKAAVKAQKSAQGKADRAVASGRATPLSSKPSPMEARVAESVKATASMKAERATGHLNNLHERAKAGTVKGDDIHKHVDIIAKGASKDELFAAAKAAGVEHKATTKKALVEHLKAHATGRMKPGGDKHEAIKESSLKDFAGKVTSGAHASPTGGFGSEKTFISHAKAHLDATDPAIRAMSGDAFKARLLDAHKAGHLELGRGDLTPSMHPGDVAASSTPHMGVEYHFVRHPARPESPAPPAPAKAPASKPAAAAPTADQGLAHLRHLQHNSRSIAPADLDAEVSKLKHLPQQDFDRAIGGFLGPGARGGKQQKVDAARKKIREYGYMTARTDKIAGVAAPSGGAAAGPLSHLPAVADRAKGPAKASAPARTVKAAPPPDLSPSSRSALEGLRSVQARAHTLAPAEIDAHVSSVSGLGSRDLADVAHHYLGSKVGGSKADQVREISRKIHGYRQAVDRVKGIEEYK